MESVVLLILAEGRSYGYEVRRQLKELGYDRAESDPGALYRLLRELEAAGFIVSEWDIAMAGPARRYYSLTPPGYDQLERGAARMANLKLRIERFLAAYDRQRSRPTATAAPSAPELVSAGSN